MKILDVTALSAAVLAADAGAESFTFLPYFRAGAVAGIAGPPFSTGAPARAHVTVSFHLDDGGGVPALVEQPIAVRGPGDVRGIDPAQVIRRHPAPGTGNAPTGDLVHIEFDQPDLPWMFTPAAPSQGRLPPWLRLVVVHSSSIAKEIAPAGPDLPAAVQVPRAELPPPEQAWAWAHVQASGSGLSASALAAHLGAGSPELNLSRLVSPRRLEPNERWTALVVPTFEAGRLAGLGQTPTTTLEWAWGARDPEILPVYDRWEFATGEALGFEELARAIVPVPAADGLGRRWVDTTQPGSGIPIATGGPREVPGALIAPTVSGLPEPSAEGRWDAAATAQLRALVDPTPLAEGDPEVGPPLYGGAHVLADTVPEAEPAWVGELNLDPAHRIAAALGTAVVRMDQEQLMAGAWAQLENVRQANEVLRAAQFARLVSTSLHRRTLGVMAPGAVLGVTSRAQAHLGVGDRLTARGAVAASALPTAATGAALARIVRPLGRTMRFLAADDAAEAATGLLADGDTGADWVLPIPAPPTRGDGAPLRRIENDGDVGMLQDITPDDEAAALMTEVLEALPVPFEIEMLPDAIELPLELDRIATLLALGWNFAFTRPSWPLPAPVVARFPDTGISPDDTSEYGSDLLDVNIFESVWQALVRRGYDGPDPREIGPNRRVVGGLVREHDPRILEPLTDGFTGDLPEPAEAPRARLDLALLDLGRRFLPVLTMPRRVATRLPGFALLFGRAEDDFSPVMAAPQFRHPLYEALSRHDREWLMPGVAAIPEPDMVTALQTNPEFVEAFLVGANHEFARELVWREYPTDGRATSLRRFWTSEPDLPTGLDRMRAGGLGTHLDEDRAGKLVFVVRGDLVRRFPHLLANVVRSVVPGDAGYPVKYRAKAVKPLFRLALSPDLLLVAADLKAADAVAADANPAVAPPAGAFWFTLAEHVGAPRFGLDEDPTPAPGTPKRDDLSWSHWVPVAGHLPAVVPAIQGAPAGTDDAAKVAWALFQKPARVGFRVGTLLSEMDRERPADG